MVDHTTRGQITTAPPGREARLTRYKQTDHFIHVANRFLQRDHVPLLLGDAEPDQVRTSAAENLRGVCRRSRRKYCR